MRTGYVKRAGRLGLLDRNSRAFGHENEILSSDHLNIDTF